MSFQFPMDTQWQLLTEPMAYGHTQPEMPTLLPTEPPEWSFPELVTSHGLPPVDTVFGSTETTIDDLTATFASIGHNSSAVAPSATEDLDEHSSWSSYSTSNDNLPDLPSLEERPNSAPSPGYVGGSNEALPAYFNAPLERVRLADGRWLYAKIIGYACDAPQPAPVKISKTILRRKVWNSAKKLLGIIQQKVHKVMLDGTIRTRTLENLPNSVATGSTTAIFYPNWKGPAGDPVNKEFLHAVIQDVKASEVIRPAQVDDNEIRILVQSYWKHLCGKYSRDEAEQEHKRVKMAHYMSNKRCTAQVADKS